MKKEYRGILPNFPHIYKFTLVILFFIFFGNTVFGQTVTIGTGTSTQRYPLGSLWGFERSASNYTVAEVTNTGSITKLAWNSTTTNTASRPIRVYLKTTTATTFTASNWASQIAGATLVYDANTTIATGWNEFTLTTPFNYTGGTNNLLVLVEANAGGSGLSGSGGNLSYSTATNKHMTITADTSAPTGNGYVNSDRPNIQVTFTSLTPCTGAPTGGSVVVSPASGAPGSTYGVTATGYTTGTGLTYQWQFSDTNGPTWTNQGTATTSYVALTGMVAPTLGIVRTWRLLVTCTASTLSASSSNGTFTSVASQNIPTSGSNTVTCGTNIVLYDNGGPSGDYANSSNGYTILEAGLSSTINITGSYNTENNWDFVRIYSGTGITGTLLGTYTGNGTINYTGTAGQTLTVQFTSDGSGIYSGFNLSISYSGICFPACSGTPSGGIVNTLPSIGPAGSSYTVSATGQTLALNMTYQWQYSTNGGGTWTNAGTATSTYSNYNATAPALGVTVLWQLVVTCTSSGISAKSLNGSFTSVSGQNIPVSGSTTVYCGTNTILYDNGGSTGNYANNSNGYTVLEAGVSATITISGSYETESIDKIRIYNGTGITGTLLATYSGTGTINYTGNAGQTLTVEFYSDGSLTYSGFTLNITYSGTCFFACTGAPSAGSVSTNPNTDWPGAPYVVSATGQTLALNMSYQWQYSTTGGTTWINAGAPSTTYSNYNATAPASGIVLWQLIVTCVTSGQSSISSTGTFTTMAVSTIVTGCPNVVSGGLGLNGTDPLPIDCNSTSGCVDLEATYLDLGETTSYIVEPIAYNPPFTFTGLANTVSVNTDDVWSPTVNLPFDFCFYGNTYNQCLVSSNGVITFDLTNNTPEGFSTYSFSDNLPNTNLFLNSIFGVYHDINPRIGGQIGWELITLSTGCRALVAAWNDVPMFSENAILYTGMIVLYENSNVIEVYIKNKQIDDYNISPFNGGNAVVGLQNANGTIASVPPGRNSLDTNWNTTNEAWRFVPNGTSIASLKWHEGSGVSGPEIGNTVVINVCPTSTTTYTAEITYTLCDGSTITEIDETVVTVIGDKTWNGSIDMDWNIANNWTPIGIPNNIDCVIIPVTAHNPIILGTNYIGYAGTVRVLNNATLTINSGNTIEVTDWVNVAPNGTFDIQNNSSLVQINNATNTGSISMKRNATIRKLDYVYWSSPVDLFSSGVISSGTPAGYVYKWTPTIGTNFNGWGNWSPGIENMSLGRGYIVRGPNSFGATAATFTATFSGTPNNGIITTPIQRGTYDGANYNTGASTTLGTKDDDNWNLIGNPYPSAIRAIDFLALNTNIDGFINVWTHGTLPSTSILDPFYGDYGYNYTSNDYITYNSSGPSSGPGTYNGFIPAGQGFFVLMNNSSASMSENVTFNNQMRSSTYNNGQFFRTTQQTDNVNEGRIWLDLIATDGAVIRNLVAYVEGATNEKDRLYDAFTNDKPNLNLYSKIGEEIMKIQGRTLPFDQNDTVPMGIKVPQNGNYSIAIAAIDGLFTNTSQNIYLEDTQTNIIHDLRQSPYTFTALSGNDANRFVLRYTNETLSNPDFTNENSIKVITNDQIQVYSSIEPIESIIVYNVLGQKLKEYKEVNSNSFTLTNLQKNNTTLLLKIKLQNETISIQKAIY